MLIRKKSREKILKALNILILGVFLLQPVSSPGLLYAVAADTNDADTTSQTVTQQDTQEESSEEKNIVEENKDADEDVEVVDNDEGADDTSETVSEEGVEESDSVDEDGDDVEVSDEEGDEEVNNEEETAVTDEGEDVENAEESDENIEENVATENIEETVEEKAEDTEEADSENKQVDDDKKVVEEKTECTDEWSEKSDAYTRCVEEGVEYVLDFDNDEKTVDDVVKITFTKIDKEANKDNEKQVTIKEVELTDEQVEQLGALSNTAYDVTSTMKNGTFEYDLVLPVAKNVSDEDVSVVYVEDEKALKDIDEDKTVKEVTEDKDGEVNEDVKVEVDTDKNEVKTQNLDHMTIFVVVVPNPVGNGNVSGNQACTNDGGSAYECYDTIQAAINAASNGDTIEVSNGTYAEVLTINKDITIQGASEVGTIIDTSAGTGYGVSSSNSDVALKNLTIIGPDTSSDSNFGIKFTDGSATFENITVKDSYKTNIDLNRMDGVVFADVTATGAQNGNGVSLTDTSNVSTTSGGITTSNNGWGGVAVYPSTENVENVVIDNLNSDELIKLYSQVANSHTADVTAPTGWIQVGPVFGYTAWFPPVTIGVVTNVNTGENFNSIQEAIDDGDTLDGHILVLDDDIVTTEQVTVTKEVIIYGDNKTVSPAFENDSNSNNSVFSIRANNVVLANMTIEGSGGTDLHGITTYPNDSATALEGILLDNVTIQNNDRSALVVNGANVTVNNIATSGNGSALMWHVIDVSQGDGVTAPSTLTITGTSSHAETLPIAHIWVPDNSNTDLVVNDTVPQYTATNFLGGRYYMLGDGLDSLDAPVQTGYNVNDEGDANSYPLPRNPNELACTGESTNINGISVHWTHPLDGMVDNLKYQRRYNVNGGSWHGNEIYTNPYTNYRTFGGGTGNDGIYGSQVRAWIDINDDDIVDSDELVSEWSNECFVTYDTVAPAKPIGLQRIAPNENNKVYKCGDISKIQKMWPDWDDNTEEDFDHYEYSSFNAPSGSQGIDERIFNESVFEYNGNWLPQEGTYGFAVRAVDKAGNKSEWALTDETLEGSCQITYDNTPPVTTLTSPSDGDVTNGVFTIAGSSTDTVSGVEEVYIYYSVAGQNNWIEIGEVENVDSDEPFEFTYDWTPEAEGTYDIKVSGVDNVGNVEHSAYVYGVTYDTTSPVLTLVTPNEDDIIKGIINLKATCDEECDYVNFWWRAEGQSYSNTSPDRRYHYIYDNGTEFTWDLDSLNAERWGGDPSYVMDDGVYYFKAAAKDVAGNWTGTTEIVVTIDNTKPAITIVDPVANDVKAGIFNVQAEVTDANPIDSVLLKMKDVDTNTLIATYTMTNVAGTDTWEYDVDSVADLADGAYKLKVVAKDVAGNKKRKVEQPIIIDNTAPTTKLSFEARLNEGGVHTDNDGWRNFGVYKSFDSVNLEIDTGDQDDDFIQYQILSGNVTCPATGDSGYTEVAHGHNVASEVNGMDGVYSLCYYGEDEVGNVENPIHKEILQIDATRGITDIVSVSGNLVGGVYYQGTDSIDITFNSVDDESGIARVRAYRYNNLDCSGDDIDKTYLDDTVRDPEEVGVYTFNSGSLADGEYCYRIWGYDKAQNYTDFEKVSFVIDTTVPDKVDGMTIYKGSDTNGENLGCNGFTNDIQITVDWNDSTDTNFDFYRYQARNGWTTTLVPSQRTGNISGDDGEYKYSIQAVDKAGNEGEYSDWCYVTLDREAPTVSIDAVKFATGQTTEWKINESKPTIIGQTDDNNEVVSVNVNVDGNDYSATITGNNWTVDVTNELADGTYTITATATDIAGNTTAVTQDIVIDTVAPTADYSYYKNGVLIPDFSEITYVKDVSELTFDGTATDVDPSAGLLYDSFVIFDAQDDGSFGFSTNGKRAYCSWRSEPNLVHFDGSNSFTIGSQVNFDLCTDTLEDGEYYLTHGVYDNAVRKDISSIHQYRDVLGAHFVMDTVAPEINIETPTDGEVVVPPFTSRVTVTDDNLLAGTTVKLYNSDGEEQLESCTSGEIAPTPPTDDEGEGTEFEETVVDLEPIEPIISDPQTITCDFNNDYPSGDYYIAVETVDAAGNTATARRDFTISSNPTVNQLENQTFYEGADVPTIEVTGEDNMDINQLCVTVTGPEGTFLPGGSVTGCNVDGSGTSYTWTNPASFPSVFDTSMMPEGVYTMTYYVVDSVGNQSEEHSVVYTLENVAPFIDNFSVDDNEIDENDDTAVFSASFVDPSTNKRSGGEEIYDDTDWFAVISYGDHADPIRIDLTSDGVIPVPDHAYNKDGDLTTTLTVCESQTNPSSEGECDTASISMKINDVETGKGSSGSKKTPVTVTGTTTPVSYYGTTTDNTGTEEDTQNNEEDNNDDNNDEQIQNSTGGATVDDEGGQVKGAETCNSWPTWAWIIVLLVSSGGIFFIGKSALDVAASKRNLLWQGLVLLGAVGLWYFFDACRTNVWMPWTTVIVGIIIILALFNKTGATTTKATNKS